jgi:hypothetical protein
MASQQEEPATEYDEEEYEYDEEEYEEEDFMNQIGTGVTNVLYGITWIAEGALILFIVAIFAGLIFG